MRCHRRRRATPEAPRNPLPPGGLRAAWGRLLRCHASPMPPHRLRRSALHTTPRRLQRHRAHFYHGLLNLACCDHGSGTGQAHGLPELVGALGKFPAEAVFISAEVSIGRCQAINRPA